MVQCRKINSRDSRRSRFAVSAVAATVTATAVVLVLVAAAITATAIDTGIYIDRDKNWLGPQPPPPPRQGGEPVLKKKAVLCGKTDAFAKAAIDASRF